MAYFLGLVARRSASAIDKHDGRWFTVRRASMAPAATPDHGDCLAPVSVARCLMKFAALALVLAAGAAQAQYKCTAPDGSTAYQQTPCAVATTQKSLKIDAAPPDAAQPRPLSADERRWERMKRERRIEELERSIADLDANIAARNVQMSNEIAALRGRKTYAKNNLAGATWEQSLSTEMQAVAAKYKALNDADFERLKVLRAELETARGSATK